MGSVVAHLVYAKRTGMRLGCGAPTVGGLDVCVSAMRLAGGAFALGAFALGAFALGVFALGAFVVHLLSETPKSADGGCMACVQ